MKIFQKKPIFISLSPNVEKDDICVAFKLFFLPRQWKEGKEIKLLENKFKEHFKVKYAFPFNSGRSAWFAILKALNLKEGEEVLLQAFTCNAAVNPILALGLKPVYVDIEEKTLNIDPKDLERKISPKSRVVLVQHTFGLPAKIDEILEICKKHNLILVEDCAHSLGAEYQGEKVGTFGKAAFFSFGRDKIISSVYGGVAITNDPVLGRNLAEIYAMLKFPSYYWIFQQLLHPILTEILIKPLYRFDEIGKYLLIFLQKIGILSKGVTEKEKRACLPRYIPQKMPNALAKLAYNQLKKLKRFNEHRRAITEVYIKELQGINLFFQQDQSGRIFMRFPVILERENTDKILKQFRRKKIFLDDGWRKMPIVPPDTNQEAMKYQFGSCPVAERIASHILNLPTHINLSQEKAYLISKLLRKFLTHEIETKH